MDSGVRTGAPSSKQESAKPLSQNTGGEGIAAITNQFNIVMSSTLISFATVYLPLFPILYCEATIEWLALIHKLITLRFSSITPPPVIFLARHSRIDDWLYRRM